MINDLIARVFEACNVAHLEHWNTGNYAAHRALGDFYDEVIDLLDSLVEAHLGAFGKAGKVELGARQTKPCVALLGEHVVWISKHREHIAQDVAALENIVDEIVALYLRTLYKLKGLS
jgi:DNA-binding ferritin-like protein